MKFVPAMKCSIIININPAPDGVRCGECYGGKGQSWCDPVDKSGVWVRGPECLGGAQRYQRMVEALRKAREWLDTWAIMNEDDAEENGECSVTEEKVAGVLRKHIGQIDTLLAEEAKL